MQSVLDNGTCIDGMCEMLPDEDGCVGVGTRIAGLHSPTCYEPYYYQDHSDN
jgi:hypothetical protein